MLFLIDENLPCSLVQVFEKQGHRAECVAKLKPLHGKSDEVVFDYAVEKQAIIVTKDLGFGNPLHFDHSKILGLMILRFPNEVSMRTIKVEVESLMEDLEDKDFRQLIILEPGSLRIRKL